MNENYNESYTCPECHSENIQRFEIAYQNGISGIDANILGAGISGGGHFGIGGGKTKGVSQTELSKLTAPPRKIRYTTWIILWIVLWFVISLILPASISNIAFIVFTIAYFYFVMYKRMYYYNHEVYPKRMEEWHHSWICFRCGNRFLK